MAHPLYVAFLWHMHQPYYQDSLTGNLLLPWVRLHAAKDYLHMAEVLAAFPRVRQNFNVVPSLVEQLEAYAGDSARDEWLRLTLKPADRLTAGERRFMADHFFSINWDRIVRRYPRYGQLLDLREAAQRDPELFSPTYWRDLQVWFNLGWIDPNRLERDADLARLVERGKEFSDADVRLVVAKQLEILQQVLPTYRRLADRGQIELSTTPYYHPILPLLFDVRSAREASPNLSLPEFRFRHPEDALEQVRLALGKHREVFGRPAEGIWPSEGAVSQDVLRNLGQRGTLRWVASDEGVLAESLGERIERDGYGHVANPRLLYRPYLVGDGRLAMVFRDRVLSDRVGFDYQSWNSVDAANDLVHRLIRIRENLGETDEAHLVSIILDGENCWEGYEHNGDPFLHHLYTRLSEDSGFEPTTIGAFVRRFPPQRAIPRVRAGTWINRNLETWIGEPSQNQAWDCLTQTRDRLLLWEKQSPLADLETAAAAWREIYIAEGSDWFWWYYSRNVSAQDALFDQEFRRHLANVYRIMGLPVPSWLEGPIVKVAYPSAGHPPRDQVTPSIHPADVLAAAWESAGLLVPEPAGGAMQRGDAGVLTALRYGYDTANLYLRVEARESLDSCSIRLLFSSPRDERANTRLSGADGSPILTPPDIPFGAEVRLDPGKGRPLLARADGNEEWIDEGPVGEAARACTALNVSLPLGALRAQLGETISLVVALAKGDVVAETLPRTGHLSIMLRGEV